MRHNPYQTGLLAAGGFALVLASILMVVVSAQTDYLTYDVEAVGELRAWTYVLCSTGAVAFIGAAVLAGMRWMLRNAAAPTRSRRPHDPAHGARSARTVS